MDYIIPDYIKNEVFDGELSENIDYIIANFDFSLFPEFDSTDIKKVMEQFKVYICYNALQMGEDLDQLIYVEVLKAFKPDIILPPLVVKFIKIYVESKVTYEELKHQVDKYNNDYFSMVRNCFRDEFKELSSDEECCAQLYDDATYFINSTKAQINIGNLVTLTKCAIILNNNKPDLELDFENFGEAVKYAFSLYKEQLIPYEKRKAKIDDSKEIMLFVNKVLDNNDFSR